MIKHIVMVTDNTITDKSPIVTFRLKEDLLEAQAEHQALVELWQDDIQRGEAAVTMVTRYVEPGEFG